MNDNIENKNIILKALRSNFFRAVLFVFILFFILRSVSYVMRMNGTTKSRFAGFYAQEKDSIDVLMIGASTVSTSLIPAYMWDKYGFTAYPLSSNSLRPKAIKYLIEEGYRYQNPKLVVVEMRTFAMPDEDQAKDEGHIREVVDNMRYSIHRVKTINALTEEFDNKATFYFDIMKYHPNYGMLFQPSEWKMYNYKTDDIMKGFEIKNGQMAYRRKKKNDLKLTYNDGRNPIPQKQEEVLKDLLDFAKDKDLQMLFVVTPRDHDGDFEGQMNYMKDIIEEYGYDVINTNELAKEVDVDYRYDMDDGAHTNVWGAIKVSDFVGNYISQNYLGTIGHSDSVTRNWNEAYKVFKDRLDNTEVEMK